MSDFISWNINPLKYHDGSEAYRTKTSSDLSSMSKNKDEGWFRYWIDRYISAFDHKRGEAEEKLYKIYRGIREEGDLGYINAMHGDNALPVPEIPHVPLIRRYIDYLVSSNSLRPMAYNIKYNDVDAIRLKDEEKVKKLTDSVMALIKQTASKQMQNPNNQQVQQQADAELQQKAQEEAEKIKDYRTTQEVVAAKCIDLCIERLNLREKASLAFLDKCTTGKEYYKCKLKRIGELPEFEIISSTDIAFSAENVDYLNKCQFVVHRRYMSYDDVINTYGHEMDKDALNQLSSFSQTATTAPLYSIEDKDLGYVGTSQANLIEVYEVEWKVNEKLEVDKLTDLGIVVDELLEEEKPSKYRYYQKLYTGTRISGNIYVKWGEVKWARRDVNDVSKVLLNYNGRLYNSRNNPPLSLVKDLRDLQNHYDMLWYKLLELILLSGVKGSWLIEELLPKDMTPEDWLYYRRMGIARLSISNEGISEKLINQLGSSLQNYDDSLSANGIQGIMAAIQQIEKTVGDICGVPPQALGQTQQYETKANTETSITQGSITVEILHKDHSNFIREALNDLLHWSKIALQKGRLKEYLLTPEEEKLMDIKWNFIDYNVFVVDSYKEEKALTTAKQMVQELVKSQQVDFSALVATLNSNSVNEVKAIIDKAIKKTIERQQANMQAEQQAEQEKLKQEMEFKKAELQLKEKELQATNQFNTAKLKVDDENKDEELAIKDRLATVEEGYLTIAKRELEAGINVSNNKLDSRKGKNDKNPTK